LIFQAVANLLTGYAFTRIPELNVPYWPFEPCLPVIIIALGAYLTFPMSRAESN
jgi:hypothetical protein